ncbi:mitochondrial outer membrane translocase complex, subunit Tom22 [Gorgonomyces haynaldii]|nr:mitochondrial outer membrane translocase complex, subunit Tom22 [Gorgonomyces haynaldii]
MKVTEVENDQEYEDIDELDNIEDETILERIAALVDVIPPTTRARIYASTQDTLSVAKGVVGGLGTGLWILVTVSLQVVVPVVLELEREQQAIQQEHQRTQAQQVVA